MPPQENNYQPENNLPPTPPIPPQINNLPPQKPPHGYAFLLTLTFLLILTGIFGVWYFSQKMPDDSFGNVTVNQLVDWKTYKNEQYGFEFEYPNDWIIKENINIDNSYVYVDVSKKADKVIYATSQDAGQQRQIEYIGNIDVYRDARMSLADFVKNNEIASLTSSTTFSNNNVFVRERVCELGGCQKFIYIPDHGMRIVTHDYLSGETNSTIQKILSTFKFISTSTPVVGGDRDAHGCIGSAGYSWCEVKNKCLRVWEEKCQ